MVLPLIQGPPPYILLFGLLIYYLPFVLLILGVCIWLLVRKNKKLRKRILKILAIIFVPALALHIFVVYNQQLLYLKKQLMPDAPKSVIQVADAYIVGKVGESYFENNFKLNKQKSVNTPGSFSYQVHYDFAPLNWSDRDFTVDIIVTNGVAQRGNSDVPDCLSDSSLCQFNLTQEEFRNLVEDDGLLSIFVLEPPYLKTFACPANARVQIDYRTKQIDFPSPTGETSWFGPCNPPQP